MTATETLARLRALLGTWEGRGEGHFPTIDPFFYEETFSFHHRDGTDYLTYEQTAHLVDADGRFLEPSHWEAGALRAEPDGAVTLSSAHDSMRVEVMRGHVTGARHEALRIDLKSELHANDPRMRASARVITVNDGRLEYAMNMATQRTPEIRNHLRAVLQRAPEETP